MLKLPFALLFNILFINVPSAQTLEGEWLLHFDTQSRAVQFGRERGALIDSMRLLSERPCIYWFKLNRLPEAWGPGVLNAQPNRILTWRDTPPPNDPKYAQWQWNLDSLGAERAWAWTTGGVSPNGDSLVVALIDQGFDWTHEDLQENVWLNRAEIPSNGLDDDQNGRTDDYRGWRPIDGDDQHEPSSHGTSVAGIVGAVGDNGKGIAGINWKVKLLLLSAPSVETATEAFAIAAYAYVLDMRRLYEQSQGQRGAYIVASNASFGIDYAQASDHPLWCALYDSLGAAGILNVAATANLPIDIDDRGDMPTSCASDFLITLTQSTQQNALHHNAAYGSRSIDLAAPGAVYTCRPGNSYNTFGGTSGAAPHAAGAAALLYAYPHALWAAMQREQPAQAALLVKRLLLASAKPTPTLQGKSVSGGILDLGAAMQRLHDFFAQPEKTDILSLYPVPADDRLHARLSIAEPGDYELALFDLQGRLLLRQNLYCPHAQEYWTDFYVKHIPQGTYVLKLSDKNKLRSSLKFVLRH